MIMDKFEKILNEKNAISHVGKKRIILNFKNGSSVEFTEKTKDIEWESVESVLFKEWISIEQLAYYIQK